MEDLISKLSDNSNQERLEGKRVKKARLEELDSLVEVLDMASHLDSKKKLLYKKLAEFYTIHFRDNLFKDQFTLANENEGTTFDEWGMFLNDRLVRTYLDRHKRTLMKQGAESNLLDPYGKGKRDNLNLIKSLEEKEKNFSSQNIIIMRLPNKYD